jgi:hypothetical protein
MVQGIAPQTVADVLDYAVRVSSREAYVSPTRGAQGNALKTPAGDGLCARQRGSRSRPSSRPAAPRTASSSASTRCARSRASIEDWCHRDRQNQERSSSDDHAGGKPAPEAKTTCASPGKTRGFRLVSVRLLAACQKHIRPVKPGDLGLIGKEHIAKASRTRRIITGVNWSVALGNPFRSFGRFAESLDSLLTEQRSGHFEPVHLLIHLACARIDYTDRGKSAVSLGLLGASGRPPR